MTQQEPTFKEIVSVLRTEESEPTYSALRRWQERYPQFHDELESHFADWATATFESLRLGKPEEEPTANQLWVADLINAYGIQIQRRQEAGIHPYWTGPLTEFEQLVLSSIKAQRTPAWQYLERITDTVREVSTQHHLRSAVLETLKALEERHMVFAWSPDPAKHPDENGRTYFLLSSNGIASLKKARRPSRQSRK